MRKEMVMGDRAVRYFFAASAWVATVIHTDGWQCSACGRNAQQAVRNAWAQVDFMVEHRKRWGDAI